MRRLLPIAGSLAVALAATALLSTLFHVASPPTARAAGVQWTEDGLDAALAVAEAQDSLVFLKFEADWCTYCRQLDAEILSTDEGGALTDGLVPVRVDFDDRANRRLVERYVILGLPTVVVLTSEGTLVGRVDGYDSREEWLTEAREAVQATDPLPALREAHAADPDDGRVLFELGDALLTHGYPTEGVDLLEQAAFSSGEPAADALFILGRYNHRVREDPRVARLYWRELATRFPNSEYLRGALFWYARAEAELDRAPSGLRVLERHARAHPGDAHAAALVVRYFDRFDVDGDRAAARETLRGLLDSVEDPDERAELAALADGE